MPAADAAPSAADADERELLRRYVDAWERDRHRRARRAAARGRGAARCRRSATIVGNVPIVQFWDFGCHIGLEMGNIAMTPISANGRPGVAMHLIGPDDSREPHGVLVFEVTADGAIAAIDAFIDADLVRQFVP